MVKINSIKTNLLNVETIDIEKYIHDLNHLSNYLTNHCYIGPKLYTLNKELINVAVRFKPDIVWIDKGLHIWESTLKELNKLGCKFLIHYSPDNHKIVSNQSRHYLKSINLYDYHITTKKNNIAWLLNNGAKHVKFLFKGFNPEIHRPVFLNNNDKSLYECDVGFVGHYEPNREELLLNLFNIGYKVKVWGGGWSKSNNNNHILFKDSKHLVAEEYSKAICGAKINLCLLSKWSQDKTTARSIELPACGGFMLAERNDEHIELFKEGIEAEFYEGFDELIEKTNYYLKNTMKRKEIAENGYNKCINNFSNYKLLSDLIIEILN